VRQVPSDISLEAMVELSRVSSIQSGISFLWPPDGAPLQVVFTVFKLCRLSTRLLSAIPTPRGCLE
jgi:hypothetical protein